MERHLGEGGEIHTVQGRDKTALRGIQERLGELFEDAPSRLR